LVLSGLFDRCPELQVVIGHMGEAVPFMLERADSVLGRFATLERPVRDYFGRNFHYTTSALFTNAPFDCLLDIAGPSRVLFAIDYALPLATADRERIAHGNAEALLGV
jgi:predicted TIM-barrel fold metal-dependent hydrolase